MFYLPVRAAGGKGESDPGLFLLQVLLHLEGEDQVDVESGLTDVF